MNVDDNRFLTLVKWFGQALEEVGEPVFVRARDTLLSIDLPPREAQRVKRISPSTVLGWGESSAKESRKWTSRKS